MKKNLATTDAEMYPAMGLSEIGNSSSKNDVIFPKLHLVGKQVEALDLPNDLTKTYTATITFNLENIKMSKGENNSLDLEINHIEDIKEAGADEEENEEPDADDEGGESDNDEDNNTKSVASSLI